MPEIVRHVARGTLYDVLGEAEVQISFPMDSDGPGDGYRKLREGDRLVVYRGNDQRLWARFPAEFYDGRFKNITPARRWWPSIYADEIMPEGLFSPDTWITGRCDAGWIIGPKARDERLDYSCQIAQPGDVVEFDWHEPRGTRDLVIHPDGTWVVEGHEPVGWTHVYDTDEFENSDNDLRSFVATNIDFLGLREGDEPHRLQVAFSLWGGAKFRLDLNRANKASFAPEDAAAHAAAIQQAVQHFEPMNPEEQAAYREAQRQSWAKGEAGLDRPATEGPRDDG